MKSILSLIFCGIGGVFIGIDQSLIGALLFYIGGIFVGLQISPVLKLKGEDQ